MIPSRSVILDIMPIGKIMINPAPKKIKQSRMDAGLTQTQAAELVGAALRTWQHWEKGDRAMTKKRYDLFLKLAFKNTPIS